eukprot:1623572-Prymnesium_polylepis.2
MKQHCRHPWGVLLVAHQRAASARHRGSSLSLFEQPHRPQQGSAQSPHSDDDAEEEHSNRVDDHAPTRPQEDQAGNDQQQPH